MNNSSYTSEKTTSCNAQKPYISWLTENVNLIHPKGSLAEQITVRIVQIMRQATDLAQISYGGHYSRKKTQATQNFNMAVIFEDGCHGVS